MNFSLRLRESGDSYLAKANEIRIEYRDINAISDIVEKYPDAQVVLEILPEVEWEMDEIKNAYILSKQKLILCLPDLRDSRLEELRAEGIPYFWGYTITSFWELNAAILAGVSEARIGAPLFFNCHKLRNFPVKKRVYANLAHEGYLNTIDGIIGSWIRPEDVEVYSKTFDTIEFTGCTGAQEEALYRIYAEQKHWPGRVDMIITNISTDAYNRMIPEDFAQTRMNCGQRCASGSPCRICYRILDLADPELIREYKNAIEK